MRSERDIQRKPRRAAASPAATPDTPAPTEPTVVVDPAVKVSYAPRSEGGPRGDDRRPPHHDGRPPRRDDRRDERRNDRNTAPRDDRRGPPQGDRRDGPRPEWRDGPRPERRDGPRAERREGPRPEGREGARAEPRGPRREERDPRAERGDRPGRPPNPRPPREARPEGWPEGRDEFRPRTDRPRRDPAAGERVVPPRLAPEGAGERLSKVLAERGLASRREADEWIEAGWVKVGGQMATLGQRVAPDAAIEIDPAARTQQAKRVTILLHKPIGYVSGQAEDGYEPASVLVTPANHWADDPARKPFHPGHARGLAPAGRLDIDSTGLLVLTQDGRIAKHLIGDDSTVEKEYLVRVEYTRGEQLPEADLQRLNHGLELDGVKLKPAKVSWANEDQLRFVLREGRKRQIRRMCELVGLKVLALKRVRIGSVVLGKLPVGEWRYLRDDERF
ncbi:pseudouridine synthase [Ideonella sp. 4Y16]|uniref:pseudouridine synthase n=1 Tax=Ideonella alba TaxID=2824118 RepID=UPI001B36D3C2|nr:pseudouridine synthase [Ideonella alba]MBQ0944774.1 pseudouridine synthase [Ideonella alba]